ncbi:PREDICTED: uncharacterized protein LOC107339805 isoform X1 [Acropora digitifera]|uniref:uncharacterized protein LOC107339805 isoform X1 n=1 Tax=Acropora digitifera TaxID=70779 RepID=UPI00077A07D8|nr:PREDICTED: uncharacterized protein LOC107339805 isoform X1 [Acropora digitifera]
MNLNLLRTIFYGLQVNLTLNAQRSMATDSLFILLLPGKGSKTEAACDEIIAGGERLSLGGPHSTSGRGSKTEAAHDKVIAGGSQCGHRWNSCCSLRCSII